LLSYFNGIMGRSSKLAIDTVSDVEILWNLIRNNKTYRPTMKSQPLSVKYFKIFCVKGLEEKREEQKDLTKPSLKVDM